MGLFFPLFLLYCGRILLSFFFIFIFKILTKLLGYSMRCTFLTSSLCELYDNNEESATLTKIIFQERDS